MLENTKTQIGLGIYADYDQTNETVILSREFLDGIIALDHEALQNLGKFILTLQKKLHDEQQAAQPNLNQNDQPVMDDQPLEEVTLESEIARVKSILEGAGIFEEGGEPEFLAVMRADVAFAEKAIADDNPHAQVQAMNKLAAWN